MSLLRRHAIAVLIIVLFVGLGILYSTATPVFEASDELNHYPFVQHLAEGHGLPTQQPGQETLWGQEGSQPPLYYALAAALTASIDTGDLAQVLDLNPHAERGVPLAAANKNMIVHTEREAFPWQGTALAVHLIRIFSVLLAAGTVLCTYRLTLDIFPQQPALALTAMALNAFLPMFLFISASVNNDTLVVLLSSIALVMLVRIVQRGGSRLFLVTLGTVLGLASLSKLSALGLIPVAGLALALRHAASDWPPKPRRAAVAGDDTTSGALSPWPLVRRWVVDYGFVLLPMAAVAGWWYWRNWRLYGDVTGLNTMLEIAGRRPETPSLLDLLGEFQGFRINFWGLFGGVNVLMRPDWIYTLLDIATVAALVGLVIWAVRVWRPQGFEQWPALLVVLAWIAVVFVALLRWTSQTAASQGRLIFPALSGICLFFALGWLGWLAPRFQRAVAVGAAGLMFALAVTAPFVAIRPAYAQPAGLIATGVPATAQPYNVDYGKVARLLAFEVEKDRIQPGDTLDVTLYWQPLAPISEDYSVYVQVFGWQQNLGQSDSYPGGGSYPTSFWSPGQIVRDRHQINIRPDAQGPGPAWIAAGLYEFETQERPDAYDAAGQPVIFPILAKLGLAVPAMTWQPSRRLDSNLDNRVRLIGYDAAEEEITPGQEWPLTLYWQVEGALDKDYTVFVHLVDEAGSIVAQRDTPPLQGFYRTSDWAPGEVLNDTHSVVIGSDVPPGRYQVLVGLYDPVSGQRLPVLDTAGNPQDTQALVTTVEVAAER